MVWSSDSRSKSIEWLVRMASSFRVSHWGIGLLLAFLLAGAAIRWERTGDWKYSSHWTPPTRWYLLVVLPAIRVIVLEEPTQFLLAIAVLYTYLLSRLDMALRIISRMLLRTREKAFDSDSSSGSSASSRENIALTRWKLQFGAAVVRKPPTDHLFQRVIIEYNNMCVCMCRMLLCSTSSKLPLQVVHTWMLCESSSIQPIPSIRYACINLVRIVTSSVLFRAGVEELIIPAITLLQKVSPTLHRAIPLQGPLISVPIFP